jgi:hypothetical protein
MAFGDHFYNFVLDELANLPGNYLEIGVFNGDGFAKIAKKHTNKMCYAIDPFIEDGHTQHTSGVPSGEKMNIQKQNYLKETENLSNVTLYELTSIRFYDNLTEQLIDEMNISIVVIDGSHHYNDVVNDYKLSLKLLKNKGEGIVIFDDTHVSDVLQAYNEFLVANKNIIVEHNSIGGAACFVKIKYDRITT